MLFRRYILAALVGAAHLISTFDARALRTAQPVQSPFVQLHTRAPVSTPVDGLRTDALFQVLGDTALFTAWSPQQGEEWWRTDGTEAGTRLVRDIGPGMASGIARVNRFATRFRSVVLFLGDDGATGAELWRTDGSPGGTFLLADTLPGFESGAPRSVRVAGERAYFTSTVSKTHQLLWVTDGTPAGTRQLRAFSAIGELFGRPNGELVFAAAENNDNRELWISDGTASGTRLLNEIYPGEVGSNPGGFLDVGDGSVLFAANADATIGRELFRIYGESNTTQLLANLSPAAGVSSHPAPLVSLTKNGDNGQSPLVLLSAINANGRHSLWASNTRPDGQTPNTNEIYFGPLSGVGNRAALIGTMWEVNSTYPYSPVLLAMTNKSSEWRLWYSNGRADGTAQLGAMTPLIDTANRAIYYGGGYYVAAHEPMYGAEPWYIYGATAARQPVDLNPGPSSSNPRDFFNCLNTLYVCLIANDGVHGDEIWQLNEDDPYLVKDVRPGPEGGVKRILGTLGTRIFFIGNDGVSGDELWVSNGSAAGTERVKNIAPDLLGLPVRDEALLVYASIGLGAKLVFGVESRDAGPSELWSSDGTPSGTQKLRDFANHMPYGGPIGFTHGPGGAYFVGAEGGNTSELWRTDGSSLGTLRPRAIVTPNLGGLYSPPIGVNGRVVFGVEVGDRSGTGNSSLALWRSDGTTGGTQLLLPGQDLGVTPQAVSGNTLYFANGAELMKTDGTPEGTARVIALPVSTAARIRPETIVSGRPGEVFFVVSGEGDLPQLWRSDGTASGTRALTTVIDSRRKRSELHESVYVNGALFFVTDDPASGRELWRTDGTAAGTAIVRDIVAGEGGSEPQHLTRFNDALYFVATGGDGRRTLWRSDGTAADTAPVRDDGAAPIGPGRLLAARGRLYFGAQDATRGYELWHSDGSAAGTNLLADFAPGADSGGATVYGASETHLYALAYSTQGALVMWAAPFAGAPPTTPPTSTAPTVPANARKTYLPAVSR